MLSATQTHNPRAGVDLPSLPDLFVGSERRRKPPLLFVGYELELVFECFRAYLNNNGESS